MDTTERFISILEAKDVVDAALVQRLRKEVARRENLAAETIAQQLVEKGYLSFAVVERILRQARGESEPTPAPPAPPAAPKVLSPAKSLQETDDEPRSASRKMLVVVLLCVFLFPVVIFGLGLGVYYATRPEPEAVDLEAILGDLDIDLEEGLNDSADERASSIPLVQRTAPQNPRDERALESLHRLQREMSGRSERIESAQSPDELLDEYIGALELFSEASEAITGGAPPAPPKQPKEERRPREKP